MMAKIAEIWPRNPRSYKIVGSHLTRHVDLVLPWLSQLSHDDCTKISLKLLAFPQRMRCRPSTRLAVRPRVCALDAVCRGRVAWSARPRPAGSCGGYWDRGISISRSGYTWLGAVRSSRADRLVTAMVSAAAGAMTVR